MKAKSIFLTFQRLAATLVAALSCVSAPAGAVGFAAELGMRHEDNLTRAEHPLDREHDTALVLGVQANEVWRLNPALSLRLEGGLGGRWWTRFDDVSVLHGDVGARLRYRTGHDFGAAWLELGVTLTGLKHLDSDIRDGGVLRNGLTVGKRFGHTIQARTGYAYRIRRAVEDVVFDLEQHETFVQIDWQPGTRWLFYAEVGAIEGELFSTASLPSPGIRRHANAVPRANDEAFGTGLNPITGTVRPRWTYQIDGVVVTGEAGFNYPLAPGLAIDVAARYVNANAAGDNEYDGYIINAGFLWQF